MNCTDCKAEGADCLTADRVRVCSDCLYERVVKERDEARAEVEHAYREGGALYEAKVAQREAEIERDEARAKVERLQKRLGDKAEVDSEKLAAAFTEGTLAAGDAMRPHIAVAYQRGAEAMREAAATAVFDRHTTGLLSPAAVTAAVRVIRALPLPEDKHD